MRAVTTNPHRVKQSSARASPRRRVRALVTGRGIVRLPHRHQPRDAEGELRRWRSPRLHEPKGAPEDGRGGDGGAPERGRLLRHGSPASSDWPRFNGPTGFELVFGVPRASCFTSRSWNMLTQQRALRDSHSQGASKSCAAPCRLSARKATYIPHPCELRISGSRAGIPTGLASAGSL